LILFVELAQVLSNIDSREESTLELREQGCSDVFPKGINATSVTPTMA